LNCSKCDKLIYAKGLCKNHYSQKLWKDNDEFREKAKSHNRTNWNKNKIENNQRQQTYYHNIIKLEPKLLAKKQKQARDWNYDHREQLNKFKRKWRLKNPEKNKSLHFNERIKKRDKKCQICGSKENLKSHHILQQKYFPGLAHNPNNGITLCHKCHLETHGIRIAIG